LAIDSAVGLLLRSAASNLGFLTVNLAKTDKPDGRTPTIRKLLRRKQSRRPNRLMRHTAASRFPFNEN
jgi:hypothetical protein